MTKTKIFDNTMYMPCPGCGTMIMFSKGDRMFHLNDGKRKKVTIPEMWFPWSNCPNPLCNWSNMEVKL